nr:hypothetical protein [Tanacetum cinerariifolium]
KFIDEIGELRAIFGHMLGAARVQIPENNLDNLHSSRDEDKTSKTMDTQDTGFLLLAVIDLIILVLGVSVSRVVGFLRGTLVVVVILVKGHAFPTIVKVRSVGLQVTQKFIDKIGELKAISDHMLGEAEVQIPENNLDNLHSSREEDGTSETMDPQDLLGSLLLADIDLIILVLPKGYDPLAIVDSFTPVDDNIGLLETRFDEEAILCLCFLKM